MSQQLLTGRDLWATVESAAAACRKGTRKVAVAYVSTAEALRLERGDVLVVNAGDASMSQGSTMKHALLAYLASGVRIYSRADLHAKVYVFGETAIIGSANVSKRASSGRSVEAALVASNKRTVEEASGFIDDLIEGLNPLTRRDITAMPDPKLSPRRALGPEIVDDPGRLWAYWQDDTDLSDDEVLVVTEATRRFRGRAKWTVLVEPDDPAAENDLVMPVWSEDGDTLFGSPARVLGRHEDGGLCVLVVQDIDGGETLTTAAEHQIARAHLPRKVRNLKAGSRDVEVTGSELEQLLELFSSAQ